MLLHQSNDWRCRTLKLSAAKGLHRRAYCRPLYLCAVNAQIKSRDELLFDTLFLTRTTIKKSLSPNESLTFFEYILVSYICRKLLSVTRNSDLITKCTIPFTCVVQFIIWNVLTGANIISFSSHSKTILNFFYDKKVYFQAIEIISNNYLCLKIMSTL